MQYMYGLTLLESFGLTAPAMTPLFVLTLRFVLVEQSKVVNGHSVISLIVLSNLISRQVLI